MEKKKALVLFSGGLDSRVVAKIMQEKGFETILFFVKLPFGGGCGSENEVVNFAKAQGFKLETVDATRGKEYKQYMKIVKSPAYGRGVALNPCKDCKIFIFKKGYEKMKEIGADILVSGEVMDQRPMSQKKKTLEFNDEKAGLVGKILRPLSAKELPETEYEKNGLINRNELFGIIGRQRQVQMKLAKKYKIDYPQSAGGCLLCEKLYCKKLNFLLDYLKENIPKYEQIKILNKCRMFFHEGLIFVGRNEEENKLLQETAKKLNWEVFFEEEIPGPTVIYEKKEDNNFSKKLWEAYRLKDLSKRKEFEKYKV